MRETRSSVKDRLFPLWVVAPVAWDFENDEPAKSIPDHIAALASDLLRDWGARPAFIDTFYLDDALNSGRHPLEEIVSEASTLGVPLIPVTGPDRTIEHHQAVARIVAKTNSDSIGACLRVSLSDALNLQAPTAQQRWNVDSLLQKLGISPEAVDVVFDFGSDGEDSVAAATLMRAILATFPYVTSWRSITFASTSIPATLQGFPTQAISRLPRLEWITYLDILAGPQLIRRPRFGDYCVQNPDLPLEVNPRFLRVFSQIRYSSADAWLIARGLELRPNGNAHVVQIAQQLLALPEYAGASFSRGDRWIEDCASGSTNPGNPEVWRRVGTNHHLEQVVSQISTAVGLLQPPGPS
jgi:hypothetical protein